MKTSAGLVDRLFGKRRYSGVYRQQGRVKVDDDWNDGSAEGTYYSRPTGESRSAVPVHTPEWTDYRESDPGISLMEVMAFLATGIGYVASVRRLWSWQGSKGRAVRVVVDGEDWNQVDNLDDAGPDARVFRLDPVTGTVEFGDGVHGKIPQGRLALDRRYTYGEKASAVVGGVLIVWIGRILWLQGRRAKRCPC
jgi:hypothetical protein